MATPSFNPEQSAALKSIRVSWFVSLAAVLPLPFVALTITGSAWLKQQPGPAVTQSMALSIAIGLICIFLGLFSRNQAYKAHWRGDVVQPPGYLKGNALFFAAVITAAAALFLISITTGYPAPTFASAPILVGLLAMNFPNGKPMLPAPPRIGEHGGLQ